MPSAAYAPVVVDSIAIGWVDDYRAARLAAFNDVFQNVDGAIRLRANLRDFESRNRALDQVTRTLADEGLLSAWRNERYAVSTGFGASPLLLLERAAARYFGVRTYAVHINGMVHLGNGDAMWIGRRSRTKAIDPGLLDNMIGGGIAAATSVQATAVKEAWEEAGVTASIAREARPVGAVHVVRAQPDGLQRETIFVHDLWLDADFAPTNQDGEVVAFRRVLLGDLAAIIARTDGDDVVTADASLVILDCLLRHGLIAPDTPGFLALESLRHPQIDAALDRPPAAGVRLP
jgi:8-oxo-dGTP pyrophosphatase MutT (NUDIX family)